MRHQAIYDTHPNVVTVDDGAGAFDENGNSVTIDEELVQAKIKEFKNAEPMNRLRNERNKRLQETDWWAAGDRIDTMTNEQKIYRKQLRDLPSTATPQLDENGQLINVTWPTKPE